jgi:hypothetical protein
VLFLKDSAALIHSERRRGLLNIHFAPFDFYKSHLTIGLIQKICENVEIIMIYLKYILDKTCHSKINNTFTIFQIRRMVKREAWKSTSVNIWDGGSSSQCRRGLANPCRFVGWCAGNGYLLYTRLLTFFLK